MSANKRLLSPVVAIDNELPDTPVLIKTPDKKSIRSFFKQHTGFIIVLISLLFLIAIYLLGWSGVTTVMVTKPITAVIIESITSSGRVGAAIETKLSPSNSGIAECIYVKEGEHVSAGQLLVELRDEVAIAQIRQAEAVVNTAQAQLDQLLSGAKPSEIQAAYESVRQAAASLSQYRAAIKQAESSLLQSQAVLAQLQAERELAANQFTRNRQLLSDGIISQNQFDEIRAQDRVAENRVKAQMEVIAAARQSLEAAIAADRAAAANVNVQQARLTTLQSGATEAEIRVAQQRIAEALAALQVAQQQLENSRVTAPFAGTITDILVEPGQSAGITGVLTLISDETEIQLDIDENNLPELAIGKEAIISVSAFQQQSFRGKVKEISAAVDQNRGTITVKIRPIDPPSWLRPGMTVNVNIITYNGVSRLLIPETSIKRIGSDQFVMLVKDDQVVARKVVTRAPTEQGVPILSGLSANDQLIVDVTNVTDGAKVRVKGRASK